MEVTKWLKPSVSVSQYTVTARVQAVTEIALHSLCVIPQLVQRNRRRLPIVRSDQGAEASRGPPRPSRAAQAAA
jgi:hypothetical protein